MPRRKKKSEEVNEKVEGSEIDIDEIIDEAEKIEKELEEKTHEESKTEVTVEEKKYEKGYCQEHGFVTPIIKGDRPACPYCQKFVITDPKKIKEILSEDKNEKEGKTTDLPEIKPPDVEFIEECIKFLKKNLPNVYGIESKKRAEAIIQTIEQNPNILYNPVALYLHIKNLAPRVNDYHLCWILNAMYSRVGSTQQHQQQVMYSFLQLLGMQNLQPTAPLLPLLTSTQTQQNIPPLLPYLIPYQQQTPMQTTNIYPYPFTQQITTPSQDIQTVSENQKEKENKEKEERKKRTYKVVIDGQVVETDDPEEYRALLDWIERRQREKEEWELRKQEWEEKRRREEQEWQLRMKKLEEEIKLLSKERGKIEEEKEKATIEKRKESENEIVRMLLTRIDSLSKELSEAKRKYEELKEQIKETERKAMEERIKMLEDELRVLREYASNPLKIVEEYERIAKTLGYTKSGKTLLDVIDKSVEGIERTVTTLINKLPTAPRKPEVKYTEKERIEKLKQVKESIQTSEEILKAEDELIKVAEKIYNQKEQSK